MASDRKGRTRKRKFKGWHRDRKSGTIYLDKHWRGVRYCYAIGKDVSDSVADELGFMEWAKIMRGEAGIERARRKKDLSFPDAAKLFLEWAKASLNPKSFLLYKLCCHQLGESFGSLNLSQISAFAVEKHRQSGLKLAAEARRSAGGKVMSNRQMAVGKRLFSKMIEWGKFGGRTPSGTLSSSKRARAASDTWTEEEQALLDQASEPLRTIILVGIYAGLRIQAEALSLRRSSVGLRTGLLTICGAYAKNPETRTIPLNTVLREALGRVMKETEHLGSEFVFCKPDGTPFRSIRTAFQTACRNAKLTDVTPHATRHTFASRLAMAGFDGRTIQDLGGWKNMAMIQRYAQLSPKHKAAAVEQIVFKVPSRFPAQVPTDSEVSVNSLNQKKKLA